MKFFKDITRNLLKGLYSPILKQLRDLVDLNIYATSLSVVNSHSNPFCKYGKNYFSQSDEDGLTLEILRRLNINDGVFAEFGVGNGLENNTLILIALGWKGFWVGGEKLIINVPLDNKRFLYLNKWITSENIIEHLSIGLKYIKEDKLDVISIDLDGNDIYFVEKILAVGISPSLFIIEYNGKFPPPVKWRMQYDPNHNWAGDDYFGASLSAFCDVFEKYNYFLVCCNSQTGVNAFFVKCEYKERFPEIPKDINNIFSPRTHYQYRNFGHKRSIKTIESLFSINQKDKN